MIAELIIAGIVILCCVFFNKISHKIGLPVLLLFIFIGMLFGSDGLLKIPFSNYTFAEQICSIALITIIFYGGFDTKWSVAKQVAPQSLLLSSAGVILTALMTGLFCHYVLKFDFLEGLLIGAVLSSTDAASVFLVLRSKKLNLKHRTASVLELESGSNDPWAYMLTILILSVMRGKSAGDVFAYALFAQIFFGVLFGVIIALVARSILLYVHFETSGFDAIFVAGIAILAYALPSAFGGNGYLSAYIVGIVLGNTRLNNKKSLVHFFDGITVFMQILVFFLLGLLATPSQIPGILLPAAAIALFLTFVARPIMVFLLMKPFKASWGQIGVTAWAGLRGATSIIFAIIAHVDDAYTKSDVFHIAFCIVLISIGLQGTLLPWVSKFMRMIDDRENVMKTFNDYSDETQVQFIRISISERNAWAHKRIREVTMPQGLLVALVLHKGKRLIPSGNTYIHPGDVLILSGEGYYDDNHMALREIHISNEHEWCNKTIVELGIAPESLIVLMKRKGKTIIPHGSLKLRDGDVLVVSSDV